MVKLLKEIFSSKNIKKALIYSSFSQDYYTGSQYADLIAIAKSFDLEDSNINEEKQIKKVA